MARLGGQHESNPGSKSSRRRAQGVIYVIRHRLPLALRHQVERPAVSQQIMGHPKPFAKVRVIIGNESQPRYTFELTQRFLKRIGSRSFVNGLFGAA